jgi:hypothetical protein
MKELKSGDTIYIRSYLGTLLDSNSGEVKARWKDHGLWETFRIKKIGGGNETISSGDNVTLLTHDPRFLHPREDGQVVSQVDQSYRQTFLIQKVGEGPIHSGDAMFLRTVDGSYVDVEGEVVQALEEKGGNQQVLLVERELPLVDSTRLNFGINCKDLGPRQQEIHHGDRIFLKASNGKLVFVGDEEEVAARHKRYDIEHVFRIEKENASSNVLNDGDRVYFRSHLGTHLDCDNGTVRARWNDHGVMQAMQISKVKDVEGDGSGVITYGDTVVLQTGLTKKYLGVTRHDQQAGLWTRALNRSQKENWFEVQKGNFEETLGFIHIPKNAGTAMEDAAFEGHNIRWGRYLMFGMFNVDGPQWCSVHHVPAQHLGLQEQESYLNKENFCVTRHPYTRALSEYSYVLSLTMDDPNRMESEAVLYRFPPCSVKGLNHFLQTQLRLVLDGPGKYVNDCHFVPQSEYIWDDDRQWCSNVLRMEDFPTAFNNLMKSRGYPVRLPDQKDNKTNAHGDLCPDLSVASMDADTIALLDEAYAVDFRRLGYSQNVTELLQH